MEYYELGCIKGKVRGDVDKYTDDKYNTPQTAIKDWDKVASVKWGQHDNDVILLICPINAESNLSPY